MEEHRLEILTRQHGIRQKQGDAGICNPITAMDEHTARLDAVFAQIPPHRFVEVDKAFGQWEGRGIDTIQYAIDNEIHHRGQGYVYLRALGIEPPPFWER